MRPARMMTFAGRCAKEILRDPLNLLFGVGFPVVLLLLLSAIQANIPVPLFEIAHLAPGIAVFGLSFLTLFAATLVARDRESAFLQRLYTTPLQAADFILGYLLPVLPIALAQSAVCYLVAVALGLPVTVHILTAVLALLPAAMFYVAFGLLCGSVFNVKQVGGICGALLTNLSAWLSGVWFDLELVGGAFRKIAYALPFVHAVELERAVLAGNIAEALPHVAPVIGYAAAVTFCAVLLFLRQMKKQ
ncbi:MAG: ABC transporter permease [Clostridia bacterium]|nr:ABC transporter permease [Clostridia bacterium]